MNFSTSGSVNIRRGRLVPQPMMTYRRAPRRICSLSVLREHRKRAATSAAVRSSGVPWGRAVFAIVLALELEGDKSEASSIT